MYLLFSFDVPPLPGRQQQHIRLRPRMPMSSDGREAPMVSDSALASMGREEVASRTLASTAQPDVSGSGRGPHPPGSAPLGHLPLLLHLLPQVPVVAIGY